MLPNGGRPRNGEMDTDVMWGFLNESGDSRFLHVGAPSCVLSDSTIEPERRAMSGAQVEAVGAVLGQVAARGVARAHEAVERWGNLINGYSNALLPDSYVYRLPQRTELRLVSEGAPLAGARVEVYLDHSIQTYQKRYGAAPDRTFTADERGVVVLPGDLLDAAAASTLPKAAVIIVGVKTASTRGYAFLPVYDLNMLHFRQGPERGEMDLTVKLLPR